MDIQRVRDLLAKAESLELEYVWESKYLEDGSPGECVAVGTEFKSPHPEDDCLVTEHFWTLYGRDAEGYAFSILDEPDPVLMLGKIVTLLRNNKKLGRSLYNCRGLIGLRDHADMMIGAQP
ncbi:hypothetical protein PU634_10430 [Oceanimonas pelagia]|uniref:Uncharacterized protein n=1 Tax=Oceanimonas pelagia TaxID=3028314 RepID=A0AA50QAT9_9GAMM|nr:hypothetical protein [Oceanimonas pelagia]WMC09532.1 hypothetical protein PU634_10430 [Oceanimonas pelagia]